MAFFLVRLCLVVAIITKFVQEKKSLVTHWLSEHHLVKFSLSFIPALVVFMLFGVNFCEATVIAILIKMVKGGVLSLPGLIKRVHLAMGSFKGWFAVIGVIIAILELANWSLQRLEAIIPSIVLPYMIMSIVSRNILVAGFMFLIGFMVVMFLKVSKAAAGFSKNW